MDNGLFVQGFSISKLKHPRKSVRLYFNESKGEKGMQYINYYQSKIVDMCQMLTFYSPEVNLWLFRGKWSICLVEVVNLVLWHLRMKIPLG